MPNRWMKLIDYWEEIDEEMKAFIHTSQSVSYRAHIGDEYYVTINSYAHVVDISRYLILSYAPSCMRVYSTGEGVSLRLDRARAAGSTRSTSRRARVSEPTRPTNPRLLANPSHQHNRLCIYCHCRYFFIFLLLTYCCHCLYSLLKIAEKKGACQNRKWSKSGRLSLLTNAKQSPGKPLYKI